VYAAALPGGSYYDWFHVLAFVYAALALAAVSVTLVLLGARGVRLYAAVAAVAALPFALGAISINSLDYWPSLFTAAGLAALVALGVHHVGVVVGRPYSLDVAGGAAAATAALFTIVLVLALLAVYAAYAAGRDDPQRLVTAAAAAVAAYVAFNRVLSP